MRILRLAPIVIVLGNVLFGAWLALQGDWYGVMERFRGHLATALGEAGQRRK